MVRLGNPPRHGRGFTLIELVVAMSIAVMLMLVAVPFTVAWADSARQLQARGDVLDAVGRAKGWALRNGGNLPRTWSQSVSRVRFDATTNLLTVENAANSGVLWSAQLPPSVSLRVGGGAAFTCTAYDSRGVAIVDSTAACNQAATQLVVRIPNRTDLNVDIL